MDVQIFIKIFTWAKNCKAQKFQKLEGWLIKSDSGGVWLYASNVKISQRFFRGPNKTWICQIVSSHNILCHVALLGLKGLIALLYIISNAVHLKFFSRSQPNGSLILGYSVWVLESPFVVVFPGLKSPGKRPLVLESCGNLLNSTKKYEVYGR